MSTTDFAFRVCRGCLTADCMNPLSSIFNHKQLTRTSEKLQKLSGIEFSCERGINDALICMSCVEKLEAAFKFGEQVRKLDATFFSFARAHKNQKNLEEDSNQNGLSSVRQPTVASGENNRFSFVSSSLPRNFTHNNGNSALKECLKRKASDQNNEENSKKVAALGNHPKNSHFEQRQKTPESIPNSLIHQRKLQKTTEVHQDSQDNLLLELDEPFIDEIQIKEEKIDDSESLVIESNPNEFGYDLSHFDDEDSEAESDNEDVTDPTYGHSAKQENYSPREMWSGQGGSSGPLPTKCDFVCEDLTCRKAFSSLWHLQRHGTIHSEARPFGCHCGKAYKRKSHLVRHQKKSHGMGY